MQTYEIRAGKLLTSYIVVETTASKALDLYDTIQLRSGPQRFVLVPNVTAPGVLDSRYGHKNWRVLDDVGENAITQAVMRKLLVNPEI